MQESLIWTTDSFENLNVDKLYKILHIRAEIFIVEQNAAYLDLDYKDQKALHLQGYIGEDLIAYCRLFRKGDYFEESSIGRVVVAPKYRKNGCGHILMQKAIDVLESILNESKIMISAQHHLKRFYESHGFEQSSGVYQEDGIPHIRMIREQYT